MRISFLHSSATNVDGFCGGSEVATSERLVVGLSSSVGFVDPASPFNLSRVTFFTEDHDYLRDVLSLTKYTVVFSLKEIFLVIKPY